MLSGKLLIFVFHYICIKFFSLRPSAASAAEPSEDSTLKKFANAKAISSDQYFGGSQVDVSAVNTAHLLQKCSASYW